MINKKQAIFTYTLTNSTLTINENDGITAVALKLTSGAGSYRGNKKIGNVDSSATSLVVDNPVTITSEQSKYIDELVIDCTGGVIEIIAR